MASEPQVTPEQLAQEHSIRFALLADLGVLALAVPVGLLGGSLTIKAEAIRFVLGMSIEIFAYTVMWRLHRGKLHDLEFGGGKLEQIANLVTGIGMLGAAAWIASKAMAIVSGHGEVGTPLGLALAAIVGALNAYVNFVAWDAMRRATEGDSKPRHAGPIAGAPGQADLLSRRALHHDRRRSLHGQCGGGLRRCGRLGVRRHLHGDRTAARCCAPVSRTCSTAPRARPSATRSIGCLPEAPATISGSTVSGRGAQAASSSSRSR